MIPNHPVEVLDVGTMFKESVGRGGYEQSFDMGKLDTFERFLQLESTRIVIRRPYLQSVKIWEGL